MDPTRAPSSPTPDPQGWRGWLRMPVLAVFACLALGALAGAGSFTFLTANGTSYLSEDPTVCVPASHLVV